MDEQQNEHQQVVDDSIEEKNTISNGNGNGSIKLTTLGSIRHWSTFITTWYWYILGRTIL